jgi:hypothetical protein
MAQSNEGSYGGRGSGVEVNVTFSTASAEKPVNNCLGTSAGYACASARATSPGGDGPQTRIVPQKPRAPGLGLRRGHQV